MPHATRPSLARRPSPLRPTRALTSVRPRTGARGVRRAGQRVAPASLQKPRPAPLAIGWRCRDASRSGRSVNRHLFDVASAVRSTDVGGGLPGGQLYDDPLSIWSRRRNCCSVEGTNTAGQLTVWDSGEGELEYGSTPQRLHRDHLDGLTTASASPTRRSVV